MLTTEGEEALVKRLTTEFSITSEQAMTAINIAWMSLAFGDEDLNVPALVFERVGDGLQVFENEQIIAVLEFDAGVLPRNVVSFVPRSNVDVEADDWDYYQQSDFHSDRSIFRFA